MDWIAHDAPITTRQDFGRFLAAMAEDLRKNPDDWATTDLAEFLAAAAWFSGQPLAAFHENVRGEPVPEHATWRIFADILAAARVVE